MQLTRVISKEGTTLFQCSCCSKEFDELPFTFGADYPDYYFSIPPEERDTRIEKTDSLCVVDEKHFFIRGRITIPIIDFEENLNFNVWTSLSETNFIKTNTLWNNPVRINEPPYFGWLQTHVPTYGDTLNIKTQVISQPVGLIPQIQVVEENHPLTLDQMNGITLEKAFEIVENIIPGLHQN